MNLSQGRLTFRKAPERHKMRNTQTWEGREECMQREKVTFAMKSQGKCLPVWLRGQCTPSNRNAMRDKKYNTARVSSYSQTGAPAEKRPAPAWPEEAHMGEAR